MDVVGNCSPRTICGSGLIDATAVLLDLGVIDATGRFTEPSALRVTLPSAIVSRITKTDEQLSFILYKGANENERDVVLTQRDIRQLQLAKAAILAGIKILMQKLDIADADIEQIFLAGAFGNCIRPESTLRIGLLPAGDTPYPVHIPSLLYTYNIILAAYQCLGSKDANHYAVPCCSVVVLNQRGVYNLDVEIGRLRRRDG